MKFKINPRTSDIVLTIYVVLTLFYRIKFENEAGVTALQSLVIGLCLVAMPWSLIKLKVLNPNWFGLFNPKIPKS
ncbi:hypothetical protein [Patiriisocius marinus]|uniref:Uncharacterized protein n=1 Tax=Patiriisocius marinus TaxID=1397112 RepID=A0A5J4J226_9FLAO|nr:hypothetical protein [Patiriisocius marinus]GER59893.1 hypothetical protein ULMA_20010 [Patiriisocius marinus]